ncbi:hypothetical protein ACIBO2_39100 [Nonomuraea sp. NPDC050022]|uniref:hypothetical protein n=1 Tax=unclassified Nonomuraea TaxID=2593643 RepID=UPI0033D0C979
MTLAGYELIDAEKAHHPIARMCAWPSVSRSGYHEWRDRPASATAQRRRLLTALATEIFADPRETYDSVKMVRRGLARMPREPIEAGATVAVGHARLRTARCGP